MQKRKRCKVYSGKHLFWHYFDIAALSSVYKTVSRINYNLFHSGDKRLLFHKHDVRFPKNLGSGLKFQKNWDQVLKMKEQWLQQYYYLLTLENLCTLLLAIEKTWKRIFNTNSELLQIHTGKEFAPSKSIVKWL